MFRKANKEWWDVQGLWPWGTFVLLNLQGQGGRETLSYRKGRQTGTLSYNRGTYIVAAKLMSSKEGTKKISPPISLLFSPITGIVSLWPGPTNSQREGAWRFQVPRTYTEKAGPQNRRENSQGIRVGKWQICGTVVNIHLSSVVTKHNHKHQVTACFITYLIEENNILVLHYRCFGSFIHL